MSLFKVLTQFTHKAEMRESKDEMLVGEIVRAMARQGHPAISFVAHSDRQQMRFRHEGLVFSSRLRHQRFVYPAMPSGKKIITITKIAP